MQIQFSSCGSTLEEAYFVSLGILILLVFVSGAGVYRNEKKMEGKEELLNDLLSGIGAFFTGRFLNERGKKWRYVFVFSFVSLVSFIGIGYKFGFCSS